MDGNTDTSVLDHKLAAYQQHLCGTYPSGMLLWYGALYKADKSAIIKRSGENPVVSQLYENGVLKGRSHELLHVNYLKAEE